MSRESGVGSRESIGMSRSPRRGRAAFTLVEMLVVVLIMALLIGILVRTLGGAGAQSDKAVTLAKIEKTKAAIEEFFAEYGQYPPVPFYEEDDMTYYDPVYTGNDSVNRKSYGSIQPVYMEYPMQYAGEMADLSGTAFLDAWPNVTKSVVDRLFTLGLTSFLFPRYETVKNNSSYFKMNATAFNKTKQWTFFTPAAIDQDRDKKAAKRWEPFLDDVVGGGEYSRPNNTSPTHVNGGQTIRDA